MPPLEIPAPHRNVLSTGLPAAPARRRRPAAALAAFAAWAGAQDCAAFDFDDVAKLALERAQHDYVAAPFKLPDELRELSYDQARDIRFKPEKALWRDAGLPYELMFFHLGKYQTQPVAIHEIGPEGEHPIPFDAALFDYGHNTLHPQDWSEMGYAGFRVHAPLNTAGYKDELAVFQGASYFRVLGRGQRYGLSARGLAIDTAGGDGEEFPRFVEFWIERPAAAGAADASRAGASAGSPATPPITLYALLDSPHATGAYRFVLTPGEQTVVDVQVRLYLRARVAMLGLAPLTSMYLHGPNQPRVDDFRPAVHDSDGLMMALGDEKGAVEWLWRPLANPQRILVTSFGAPQLQGFGLMQRERRFAGYEDTEARYELRPSVWITPLSAWGPGRVELVQLPTPDETNDNIVTYWVPAQLPDPGVPLDFAYRMLWQGDEQQHGPMGWAVQTRRGHGFIAPGTPEAPNEVQFVVDFDGPALRALPPDAAVQANAWAGAGGRIVQTNAYRNDATGAWRMSLRVEHSMTAQPLELRAFLQSGTQTLTETWTTILPSE